MKAMDHILENNDNPVPDLSAVSSSNLPRPSTLGEDEDEEDAAALRAAIGLSTGATSEAGGSAVSMSSEAKVCTFAFVCIFMMHSKYLWTSGRLIKVLW